MTRPTLVLALPIALLAFRASVAGQAPPRHSTEGFDTVSVPLLPAGWSTTTARDPGGDFVTTSSGASSAPGCVLSGNATIRQSLTSPSLDLTGWRSCVLSWNERRSASHDATLVIEGSADGGATFLSLADAPLSPPGGTAYVARSVRLPAWTDGLPGLLLRWTVAGDGGGSTGTIRLDDVVLAGAPERDLSIRLDTTSPRRPIPGSDVRCAGVVVNNGTRTVAGASVAWALDTDGNGVPSADEFKAPLDMGAIAPGDSPRFEFPFVRPGPALLTVFAIVHADSDMVPSNDTAMIVLPPAASPGSVVITEIMYDPLAGLPEYVELLNRSGAPVDFGGWRLVDDEEDSTGGRLGPIGGIGSGRTISGGTKSGGTEFDGIISNGTEDGLPESDRNGFGGTDSAGGGLVIPDGGYLLATPDSTLDGYPEIPQGTPITEKLKGLSLNNSGDLLLLLDESGGAIDRVEYSPSWHTPALEETQGRSLERIDPGSPGNEGWNWGTSAGTGGGTPGGPNSLVSATPSPDGGLECSPNPFSPDGDGFEDVTMISVRPGSGSALARVRIYDVQGRLVRTLTAGGFIGPEGSFAWNGYDDRGRKAPIGIYVVVVDTLNGGGDASSSFRAVVVVAGKL